MAIIVKSDIDSQSPSIVNFSAEGLSTTDCTLGIKLRFIAGHTINIAVGLEIITKDVYCFDKNDFLKGYIFDSCKNGDVVTMKFKLKRIVAVPPAGLPICRIKVITWDKSSNNNDDKKSTNVTFNT